MNTPLIKNGTETLFGDTHLAKIKSLSKETEREIFIKLELCNPAGCVKDRVLLSAIFTAESMGLLTKNDQNK